MPNKVSYVVVGTKPWNRRDYETVIQHYPGTWHYIDAPSNFTHQALMQIQPRYVFFLHWSHKVPNDILNDFECVVFHMTDVPYGRGGSPLQNLIVRGRRATKLTALRMVEDFDAGPVYLKRDLSLEGGSAEEIYMRASHLSAEMIETIITQNPQPIPQTGEPTVFKRRKPAQSAIPELPELHDLHDFIRMLDADGYPKAFLEVAGFRYEFSRATRYDGRILADVTITRIEKADKT